jgi:hypothetical protein
MISSLIFGWLRVLSVLSARWDWSVRALDDVRERSFDHTFRLSELGEVPIDNRSILLRYIEIGGSYMSP